MDGLQDFHYAITQAQLLYDIDFTDIEKAEEIGLIAYNFIGNHHTHLYRANLDVDQNGYAELPCNVLAIESVTEACHEDWESSSPVHEYGNLDSRAVEDYIESRKFRKDPIYQSGRLLRYRQEGRKLFVGPNVRRVSLLYHGEMLDENDLPYLNHKEATAIADYLGYVAKYKEAMRTSSQEALRMAQDLNQKWLQHCDAARVPVNLSQNDMDAILDAKTTWNRKKYHFSFKPTL